ncbi:haloacid dehalogenase-like hydrolase [Protomyces lactucae-debilis]|uniref:Haloacid dehalogenase-like hydrolase n=1 Tax=Protomyces lactucae-debilis TaxID=2754530 RepID=A0A1Y2FJU3_PROLT|nr:haloacid dehalogenase-like hydrolase [Protomyces lactucae-debilis]ORY84242.1 haloacid dehalogenase-like hydrolase [Protomyces lactucae-debilis]
MAVKACLFDMDGLLIDSESIYTQTTELLLANHGRPAKFPIEVKSNMMGRPGPQAAQVFLDWAQIPGLTVPEYIAEQKALQLTRFPHVQPLPGAVDLVSHLKQHGVGIALATSSTSSNYALKSSNLARLFDLFEEVRVTGDDARVVGRGKPQPDIFLTALADLNAHLRQKTSDHIDILPAECLVFEDGVPGVEAGLAAGMRVIWVPDQQILSLHRHQVDEILCGRGEMLLSLQDFDYAKYELPTK